MYNTFTQKQILSILTKVIETDISGRSFRLASNAAPLFYENNESSEHAELSSALCEPVRVLGRPVIRSVDGMKGSFMNRLAIAAEGVFEEMNNHCSYLTNIIETNVQTFFDDTAKKTRSVYFGQHRQSLYTLKQKVGSDTGGTKLFWVDPDPRGILDYEGRLEEFMDLAIGAMLAGKTVTLPSRQTCWFLNQFYSKYARDFAEF